MTELNLSPAGQAVAILVLLVLLWLVLKHRPTRISLDEPKPETVEESTPMDLNPDYGHYIRLGIQRAEW
ncbi:hypothetical protein I1A59_00935 [Streptococcus mitis]|nr:hypothetical protein [Streptococcus sp. NLN76]